jgi:hypothetical protein
MGRRQLHSTSIMFRILETIFLFGVVATYVVTPAGENWHLGFAAAMVDVSVQTGPTDIVISSVLIGYLASMAGTAWQWRSALPSLRWWSVGLSCLGLLSCINEVARFVIGYDLRIWIQAPIVVVIFDWIMLFKRPKSAGAAPATV